MSETTNPTLVMDGPDKNLNPTAEDAGRTVGAPKPHNSVGTATIVTDNFNRLELGSELWTFDDPYFGTPGATEFSMTTTQVQLDVPAGTPHTVWTGEVGVPCLKQKASDGDFDLRVRVDSPIRLPGQCAGMLFLQGHVIWYMLIFVTLKVVCKWSAAMSRMANSRHCLRSPWPHRSRRSIYAFSVRALTGCFGRHMMALTGETAMALQVLLTH